MLHRLLAGCSAFALLMGACGALAQPAFRDASSAAVTGGVSYVNSGGASVSGNCGTAVSPSTPAGVANDLLIALYSSSDSSTAAPSAGWNTLLASNPVSDHTARIYWRVADGTASDNLSVARGGTCNVAIGRMSRFRNVDTANPFDSGQPIPAGNCTAGGPRVKCSYQNAGSVTSGSETTVTANAMSIFAVLIRDDNATGNPAGFTEAFDSGSSTGIDVQIALKYRQEAAAGAIAAVSINKGGGSDPNHGVLFALRPVSPPLVIATPAATQAGDLMVAAIAVQPSTITIATPAGWTAQAPTVQAAGNPSRQQLFVKFATLADIGANQTWTFGGGQHADAVGGISAYVGADATTPIDAVGGNVTPSGTTHTANSINTTVANTRLVSAHSFTSSRTWTAPTGMTERVDIASLPTNNASGISMQMADVAQALAGATGNKIANAGGNADTGVAHLIALRSARYFDIQSGDTAVRCAGTPIEITIIVRAADGSVLTGYAGLVNLSTSSGNGTWSSAGAPAANGALVPGGGGTATYQFVTADSGMVRLRLANTTATTLTVSVQEASTGITSTGGSIAFINAGYAITNDAIQVAGRPQAMSISYHSAPGCAPNTGAGHNANKTLKMWLNTAAAHPGGATLPGAAGVTALASIPTAEPANNITFAFSGGTANFTLTTSDVGKYILYFRDGNTARRGSSAAITTRPFGLAIRGANAATPIQHGADHTSALLAAAGDNFSLTVAAYLWSNADDGNNDGVPDANANITNNGLVARYAWDTVLASGTFLPVTGVAGTLSFGGGTPTFLLSAFSGGAATAANARYSEVGNVQVVATATNYLDTPGVNVTGNSSMDGLGAHIGRFRPKHFALDGGTPPTLANRALLLPCASTFSYMGEGMRLTLRLLAQNTQNATTQNYTGAYARQDLAANPKAAFGIGARSGTTDLTARVSAIYPGATPAWANGVLEVPAANSIRVSVSRATPDNPDGPFTSVGLGIAPAEPDGVAMNTLDFDADNNAANERKSLGVAGDVRYGRLRLLNAVGSERIALPVGIRAEYWAGAGFQLNAADNCTTLARDAFAMDFTPVSNLTACETAISAANVAFTGGLGALTLAAPGAGNNGSVLLTPQLRAPAAGNHCPSVGGAAAPAVSAGLSYLLGRWNDAANPDGDANTAYDDNPAARAAFGLYGAQPSGFIYFRENY